MALRSCKDAAEYHKAIKLVDGVMEAEGYGKSKDIGVTVDVQMLEFVWSIGTTAYTYMIN